MVYYRVRLLPHPSTIWKAVSLDRRSAVLPDFRLCYFLLRWQGLNSANRTSILQLTTELLDVAVGDNVDSLGKDDLRQILFKKIYLITNFIRIAEGNESAISRDICSSAYGGSALTVCRRS